MKTRLYVLCLAVGAHLSACEPVTRPDEDAGPGVLPLTLQETVPGAAGLLLVLEGGPIEAIRGKPEYYMYQTPLDDGRTLVLVRGDLAQGTLADVSVPDRRREYLVRVVDGSAGSSAGYNSLAPERFRVRLGR
jgi:hypothetical protein